MRRLPDFLRDMLGRLRGDRRFESLRSDVAAEFECLHKARQANRERLDALGTQMVRIATDLPAQFEKLREDFSRNAGAERINFDSKNIFIVGHARTGTTILFEALNSSRDIFIFGEANLHQSGDNPSFHDWYNQMHKDFGNPRRKGLHCPNIMGDGATGLDYVRGLGRYYKWVGDKVAFRDASLGYDQDKFLAFQEQYFFEAKYICTMRHPASTLRSNAVLFEVADLAPYVRSYVKTVQTIVEISQIMFDAKVVVFEHIDSDTFAELSKILDCDLSEAARQYDPSLQSMPADDWSLAGISPEKRKILAEVWNGFLEIYDKESLSIRRDAARVERFQKHLEELLDLL